MTDNTPGSRFQPIKFTHSTRGGSTEFTRDVTRGNNTLLTSRYALAKPELNASGHEEGISEIRKVKWS